MSGTVEAVRPYKLREKMRQLVQVAEPALQKSPQDFLERLKEKVRNHQEWEDSRKPLAKASQSYEKGGKRRNPMESKVARPFESKRREIDPTRGKNLECYACGKTGHPINACPDNPTKEKVAKILKGANKTPINRNRKEITFWFAD